MEQHSAIASIWGLVTVVGPALFLGILLWVTLGNRKRTRAEKERTEQATRDLYEQSDIESKARDAGKP
jgi:hypothetical protein